MELLQNPLFVLYLSVAVYYVIIPVGFVTNWWLSVETMAPNGTILVTGGAGYVGSHTVVELLNNNYSVIALDNLVNCYAEKNQKPESLKRVEQITKKQITFYNIDIRNKDALDKVFKTHKIDAVIHFAALKAVGESVQVPLMYYQNNIAGSSTLFEVMQNNGVKKVVFSSSATVYGLPQHLPITETHPTGQNCTNPYGKTKFFVEEILKDVCTSDAEWKVILLRYFNPVGAHTSGLIGEDPSGTPNNLMPYISQVAIGRREKVFVFGNDYSTKDGTGVRDYIHITDLAIGHLKALEKMNESGFKGWKAYNLGTGQGYSVLDLINAFERASGQKINYEIVKRREGDIASSFADPSLAKKELNWTATRGVDEMCRDTWNWQKQNPNGFQK
ncbi:UDP-glucose 4-epimerase isoform X1 [Tribolium madens]|uniref:UDP-glucose 4-epimerase isoform X1 n=2 Tax=Tribolium madens TaxID=41895 RepID=UPI001CF74EF6|nr:UDP-glucose 4-epimerase isoform X1 [Tribolium madens]XP_044265312.1 UDP-glucose 4-epimerase isoform X1 [Tribolium madens]